MSVFRNVIFPRPVVLVLLALTVFFTPVSSRAQSTTTTTLQSSSCSAAGCVTTLTATVTAGAVPVHPGLVLFCKANVLDCADSLPLGQAQLIANGTATVKLVLPSGSNSVSAIFQGTKSYGKSASAAQNIVIPTRPVVKQPTVTDMSISGTAGAPVFGATVTTLGQAAPTGAVSFLNAANQNAAVASAELGAGQTSLGAVAGGIDFSSAISPDLSADSLVSGDFNSDGLLDLIEFSDGYLYTLLNNGTEFSLPANSSPIYVAQGQFSPPAYISADFNSDGKLDLAVLVQSHYTAPGNSPQQLIPTQVLIFFGNGDGTFTAGPVTNVNMGSLAAGDFNGDGIPDLVGTYDIGNFENPEATLYNVVVLLGAGDGTFQQKSMTITSGGVGAAMVSDFNQDGIQDLLIAAGYNFYNNNSMVLLGNGDGTFTQVNTLVPVPGAGSESNYVIGDFDNDGIPDLATYSTEASASPSSLYFFHGKGDGTFSISSPFTLPSTDTISATDLNGDGILDLVGVETGLGFIGYIGKGDGTFSALPLYPTVESTAPLPVSQVLTVGNFSGGNLPNLISIDQNYNLIAATPVFYTVASTVPQNVSLPLNSTYNIFASYPGDALHNSGVSATVPLSSTPVSYPNGFEGATGLSLNGGAAVQGSAIQLTDAGTTFESRGFFNATRVSIQAFSTTFDFQLLNANADGFAFVVQSNGPDALGSAGGGLGYSVVPGYSSGPSIPNSVAVKFDLHNDQGEGNNSVGVYTGGALPTVPAVDLTSSGIDLHNGDPFQAVINYSGTALTLTLTDQTTHASFTHSFTVNVPEAVGGDTAFVGFTAATGTETAVQNILSWSYTAQTVPYSGPTLPSFAEGFVNVPELNENLAAEVSGSTLQLIQPGATFNVGTAYFTNPLPTQSFSTDFNFQLGAASQVNEGGDGFTFTLHSLQGTGYYGAGSYGENLGYATSGNGAGTEQSLAIKFDLHNNAGEGDNSTGLYLNGAIPTVPAVNLNNLPDSIRLHNGHTFHARIHYDGTNLYLSLTDLTDYAVYNGSFPVNIPQVVGASAYAGFTSATGADTGQTQILNWTWFNNQQ